MLYTISETILSPETTMSFTLLSRYKVPHSVLWHGYDPIIIAGTRVIIAGNRLCVIDDVKLHSLTFMNHSKLNRSLWETLKATAGCAKYVHEGKCTFSKRCCIKKCPYGYR